MFNLLVKLSPVLLGLYLGYTGKSSTEILVTVGLIWIFTMRE